MILIYSFAFLISLGFLQCKVVRMSVDQYKFTFAIVCVTSAHFHLVLLFRGIHVLDSCAVEGLLNLNSRSLPAAWFLNLSTAKQDRPVQSE